MAAKLLKTNDFEILKSEISQCFECQDSQAKRSKNKTRRSNSFPGSQESFKLVNEVNITNKHRCITKRWHSIAAIHLANITPNESNQELTTSSGIAQYRVCDSWFSLKARSGMSNSLSLGKRVTSLFALGVLLALLLNFLQKQRGVTVFSPGVFGDVLNSAWWIPPTFGLAAIAIGLLYPKLDKLVGNHSKLNQEWSSVMRCIAVFVGINHASAKITFDSNIHLSITLGMLSIGLWYFFDHSLSGLGIGLAVTGVATTVTQILVAMDVFGYANPDFLYMQSWVPCLYFSGGITIGAVGRALDAFDDGTIKQHIE